MDAYNRRFSLKHFLIVILILIIILAVVISISQFTFRKQYTPPTALAGLLPRYRVIDMDNIDVKSDIDKDGINDQKDIMMGAKIQLEVPAINIFSEGLNESNYYSGGDPPPELAICTDIIARAFKEAGFDIRQLVFDDISSNFSEYPLRSLWGQNRPDPDIDYRRIQNLEVFFKRNAKPQTMTFSYASEQELIKWLPGDIVFFDMNRDGHSDNAGIISDFTTRKGIPKIIYNFIEPGYTVESEILTSSKITGHYRWP
jgi:uncharacterized protein YijF (DUF1287 family)